MLGTTFGDVGLCALYVILLLEFDHHFSSLIMPFFFFFCILIAFDLLEGGSNRSSPLP